MGSAYKQQTDRTLYFHGKLHTIYKDNEFIYAQPDPLPAFFAIYV